MRWMTMWMVVACVCGPAAQAEGIEQVLERSQQMRLDMRPAANPHSDAAQRVRASLHKLLSLPGLAPLDVHLHLVGGPLFAEALLHRPGLAVSEAVGDLPEGERLLLLAHELGHVRMAHAGALKALYKQHIPGEVRPDTTDPAAAALGPQAHALSHRQEFEADAYGFALVRALGFGVDTAQGLLLRQGLQMDSATHPGTRRRLSQLRALDARLAFETVNPADAQGFALAWPGR
jgi:hypothetical protein